MKCCQEKPELNMSSQKESQVNPLSTGSLPCSNAVLQPIKTTQKAKSMKEGSLAFTPRAYKIKGVYFLLSEQFFC